VKKIYFIRDAKAENFCEGISDFERALKKKAYKELQTIASYMLLRGIRPDAILSSCALRAQQTALFFCEKLSFEGNKLFLEELYYPPYEDIVAIIKAQESSYDTLFVIGHGPFITELTNRFSQEPLSKIPHAGVACVTFDIEEWNMLKDYEGKLEFFIYPKQFKYYMPKQIRAELER